MMTDENVSKALNMIPYGFYALTSRAGDDRNVMVCNWFSQVSFEPQHIVVGLQNTSYTMGLVKKSRKFAVNIFNKANSEAIKPFTKSREKNPEKFASAKYTDGPVTGVPVLDSAAAYLECEVVEIMDTGAGHSVVLAKVVGGGVREEFSAGETLSLPHMGWSYAG